MCVIERNPKPPRLQKVSNVLTTNNEKVIIREFIGYAWGGRCRLCGKFRSHYGQFSASRYMDFRRPDSLGQQGISNESFFSLEEIRAKFPDVPIYEFSYEDVQYHFVP